MGMGSVSELTDAGVGAPHCYKPTICYLPAWGPFVAIQKIFITKFSFFLSQIITTARARSLGAIFFSGPTDPSAHKDLCKLGAMFLLCLQALLAQIL